MIKKQNLVLVIVVAIVLTLGVIGVVRFLPIPMLFNPSANESQSTSEQIEQYDNSTQEDEQSVQMHKKSFGDVINVDSNAIVTTMAESTDPMVMKFYTTWCPACMAAKKVYPAIAKKLNSVAFYSINIENKDIMEALEKAGLIEKDAIQAIPTFVFYQKDKVNTSVRGFAGQDYFEMEVAKHFGA